ncbi:hypothetical protein RSOLAG1IB_12317 [Rhizoctonia solani AG-1 IB]|uniref:Uncharacterized protein n=1 Tax=Thanatephorus cucumeris (strain AG1-IB / isolate 7/3/14) TaxID=1108050 RepID=A0A0B7FVI3_THACB|nr:hypothetical protein RSOLAG1IB_12317 [Rhizoctonia solani AG-1 IB]
MDALTHMPKSSSETQKQNKLPPKNRNKEPKVPCPHCHKEFTQKTVRDHVAKWRADALLRGDQIDLFPDIEPGKTVPLPDQGVAPNMEEDPFLPEPTIDLPENTHETNSPSPEQVLLPQNSSIRRNPPVTIEDWPEPELDPPESNEDEPIPDGPGNQDYAFEDDTNDDSDRALGFAELSDAEFHNLLRQALGDAFNDEVEQLYNQAISTDDVKIIKMLSAKIRAHFSRQAYNEIRDAFLEELGLPSLRLLHQLMLCFPWKIQGLRYMSILSGSSI